MRARRKEAKKQRRLLRKSYNGQGKGYTVDGGRQAGRSWSSCCNITLPLSSGKLATPGVRAQISPLETTKSFVIKL